MAPRPVLDPSGMFRRIPLQPHQLTEAVTPTQQVFVLAHLGVPHVDPATWTLEIDGLVHRPRSYTLSELKRYPKREIQSFHECAGNPLTPHIAARRIANVIWGGVDLRTLLDETGVDGTATYLCSHGDVPRKIVWATSALQLALRRDRRRATLTAIEQRNGSLGSRAERVADPPPTVRT